MKVRIPSGDGIPQLGHLLRDLGLRTVCEEAGCPNLAECWTAGTATFMILGERCTRSCGFCLVDTRRPEPLDADEPARVAEAVARMGLDVAVIVLHSQAAASRPAMLQQWVAEIRGRLRGGDLAGMLSEREVGILLAGASAADVTRVSSRVCQQALKTQGGDAASVALGAAARSAGSTATGSLVKEARQDAVRRKAQDSQGLS